MPQNILLIDDDALLRRSLAYTLWQAGYAVRVAGTALEGLKLVGESMPDLVLLDIGLPGMDGLDALEVLRREENIPVILLTARRGERDESLGLKLGADDYVKKPYDTDVLLERIAAVLRRARPMTTPHGEMTQGAIAVGGLEMDPRARTARIGGCMLELTPRAFELLYVLASRPNEVVPLAEILTRLWGADYQGEPQVLYVHIRWLREQLTKADCHTLRIMTVHRVGYKLVVEG